MWQASVGYDLSSVTGADESLVSPDYVFNEETHSSLNDSIYGHKLTLQTGIRHVSMRDQKDDGGAFDGYAQNTGIRLWL